MPDVLRRAEFDKTNMVGQRLKTKNVKKNFEKKFFATDGQSKGPTKKVAYE